MSLVCSMAHLSPARLRAHPGRPVVRILPYQQAGWATVWVSAPLPRQPQRRLRRRGGASRPLCGSFCWRGCRGCCRRRCRKGCRCRCRRLDNQFLPIWLPNRRRRRQTFDETSTKLRQNFDTTSTKPDPLRHNFDKTSTTPGRLRQNFDKTSTKLECSRGH